jgi:hypothetical protein
MLQITDISFFRPSPRRWSELTKKKSRRDLRNATFQAETWKRRMKRSLLAEEYISDDVLFVGTLRR